MNFPLKILLPLGLEGEGLLGLPVKGYHDSRGLIGSGDGDHDGVGHKAALNKLIGNPRFFKPISFRGIPRDVLFLLPFPCLGVQLIDLQEF